MKLWGILLGLIFFSYYYLPIYLTYIVIASLIYKILKDIHILGEPAFTLGTIKKADIFYLNLKGAYYNCGKYVEKLNNVMKKFNLTDNYNAYSFGFFLDDPKKVKEEDLRYILGLGLTGLDANKELEEYLLNNGWSKGTISPTSAVITRMSLISYKFIIFALSKYYKNLKYNLCNKEFVQRYKIGDIDNIPGIMEVYEKNQIVFYIPCGNFDKFDFFLETFC